MKKKLLLQPSYVPLMFGMGIYLVLMITMSQFIFAWFNARDRFMPVYARLVEYSVTHKNAYLSLFLFDQLTRQKLVHVEDWYHARERAIPNDIHQANFPLLSLDHVQFSQVETLLASVDWHNLPDETFTNWARLLHNLGRCFERENEVELAQYYLQLAIVFDPAVILPPTQF